MASCIAVILVLHDTDPTDIDSQVRYSCTEIMLMLCNTDVNSFNAMILMLYDTDTDNIIAIYDTQIPKLMG